MYQVAHELCQLMQKQDSACSSLKGHDLPAVIKELANKAIIVCPAGTIESPHWDLNKKADIFQTTFWNTFSLKKKKKKSIFIKARYGGSNMKKINNGGRLLIFYMMEGIKKVNWKNGILWLFSVTDPPKIQDGHQI